MITSSRIKFLLPIGLIAALLLVYAASILASKKIDTIRRPWAYSTDPSKPLLVGKWQGSVTDPNGKQHHIELEILEPTSDKERGERLVSMRRTPQRISRTFFDGVAVVEADGHRQTCEIWGGLDAPGGRQIQFQLQPLDDAHLPGFNLASVEGSWQENTLELSVSFVFVTEDGASYFDSSDPRHEQKGMLKMARKG